MTALNLTQEPFDPAKHALKRGVEYPYHEQVPKDWAEKAACAILYDLGDRSGIKHGFRNIDLDIRIEIVESLASYVRAALAQSPVSCAHRIVDARNPIITSGYLCLDCGSLFAAADHDNPKRSPVSAEGLERDAARLTWMQEKLIREASMRFPDGSFKSVNAWSIASAGTDLREAVDAAIAAADKGGA